MTVSFDRGAEIYDKTRGLPPYVMRKVVEVLTMNSKTATPFST